MQISRHHVCLRIVPLPEFRDELKKPCQPVGTLKAGASFSSKICGLLRHVVCGETLPQCFASTLHKRSVRERSDQANEQPMSVHRRMPVVAAIKCWRQLPWRGRIRITVQCMANVVWVLFVNAGEGKIRKSLSRVDVELIRAFGVSTHGEENKY